MSKTKVKIRNGRRHGVTITTDRETAILIHALIGNTHGDAGWTLYNKLSKALRGSYVNDEDLERTSLQTAEDPEDADKIINAYYGDL